MSKSPKKSPAKKSKAVAKSKGNGKATKKPNPVYDKVVALMLRKDGCTVTDLAEAGFKYASIQAMRIAERRGLEASKKKVEGELTRYMARKA